MGSKGSSTTTQSFQLPKEFRDAYKKSIDMATQATSSPYQAYTGQLVAGFTPSQQQGLANINAAQGMALPAISQGMDLTRRAAQGITPELYQQFYSPYTRDVANTTMANLMESSGQQRSGLKSGAIQAGAFGGDRGGIAQAEMARQQNLALGQTMGNIYNQGYGQAMQLAGQQAQNYGAMGQQLAGLGVGAQGSVLQGAQAQMAAGAQQQATDQAQLQAAYEQWMQRQAYPYQQAQFFANIAQGLGAGAGGTSSTTTPGPSWGSQALGAIGAIGSIASMSDKRVKENIEAVGTLNDGQTIYRYNFKGDPKTQIGLLAQEVETREPGAVTDVKGLKMVDYKGATDKAASMGGLVTPDMQREAFAAGGTGGPSFYPYASLGYVPEGKIQSGGNRIPDMGRAPPPFEDKGLAEDWQSIKPLTDEQVGGLKALVAKMGLSPSEESEVFKDLGDVEYGADNEDYARGGLVGRHGYALDGAVEEESGLAAAPEPMADEDAGLAAAEEKPRSRFDIGRLFASEENPSIIETVMGRRLSPAARAAVMNASFAMMAGRSPFMGVNIGEAGKVGAQTYYNALAQERELAKQKADIGRQAYEAETGRMTAETAALSQARQLYFQTLPQIKFWISRNPGKPLPEEYRRLIEAAYPPQGPAGVVRAPGLTPNISARPPAASGSIGETPPVSEEPSAATTEGALEEIPAPSGATASTGNPELDDLYSQLPDELNPNFWVGMAQNAQTMEDYLSASRQAIDLTKQYQDGGIPIPSGTVTFPGQEQKIRTEKAIGLDVENVSKFDSGISEIQSSLSSRKMISEGLRESLSRAETGKFASIKADLISALNTFGLATPEQLAEAADIQTAMKYFAQSILDSGMKDKIGPQISNADLQLVATGTGSVENIAAANRRIVGAVYGKLMHDQKKAEEWNKFVIERGGIDKIKSVDVREWQQNFGENYKLSEYVQEGIKNTPVKGEIGPDTPLDSLKVGYKYVMPDGTTKVYTGIEEDGFFTEVE